MFAPEMIRNSSQNLKEIVMKTWKKRIDKLAVRGERVVFWGPNMNTNIIQIHIFGQIRIQIIFGL